MKRERVIAVIEEVIIILSVFSLWPVILHGPSRGSKILMYLALFLLALIFIRRIIQFKGPRNQ